jgi:predicted AAA+ superfamily ATPase
MIYHLLLKRGILKEQIIFINFEDPGYYDLQDDRSLYNHIKKTINKKKKAYFLFDEIQFIFSLNNCTALYLGIYCTVASIKNFRNCSITHLYSS